MDTKCYEFAENGIWAPVEWGCVLRVTGEDAAEFLQGQFSQELREGRAERVAYGFWLTRTGKVQGDSWVVREGDGTFTVLSRGLPAAVLIERLEHHIIADEVYLEDLTEQWRAVGCAGERAMALLAEAESALTEGAGWALRDPVGQQGGSGYLVARAEPENWGAVERKTEVELERRRIASGVPRVPVDVGENDLPQEGGLERVGVSFNKGCYLGQEVMARVQATGRVRRRLVRVQGEGAVPGDGEAPLFAAGRKVGGLRSRVDLPEGGWLGLAMVGAALDGSAAGEVTLGEDGPVLRWQAIPAG